MAPTKTEYHTVGETTLIPQITPKRQTNLIAVSTLS